jgi:hypothetical protein
MLEEYRSALSVRALCYLSKSYNLNHKKIKMLQKINFKFNYLGILLVLLMADSCNNSEGNNSNKEDDDTNTDSEGFVQIFDGKTFKDWEGDSIYWRIEKGSLIGEISAATPPLKNNTFLIWRGGLPADFEFKAEYRISKQGNSGINYRSEALKDIPYALKGYQADIDGANQYTGQNYEERGRTTLAYRGQKVTIPATTVLLKEGIKNNAWTAAIVTGSLGDRDSLKTNMKSEEWNECHLIVKGNHLQHYINGVLMSDVTDNDTTNGKAKGLLGLQVHVMPSMKVEYRNIRLKQN